MPIDHHSLHAEYPKRVREACLRDLLLRNLQDRTGDLEHLYYFAGLISTF
jgi:hypothetical protein